MRRNPSAIPSIRQSRANVGKAFLILPIFLSAYGLGVISNFGRRPNATASQQGKDKAIAQKNDAG